MFAADATAPKIMIIEPLVMDLLSRPVKTAIIRVNEEHIVGLYL